MLNVNVNEIYVRPGDVARMVESSIDNYIEDNNLTECDDHFALDDVSVFNRANNNFEIVFSGTYFGAGMSVEDFKFSFTVPHNFNMSKVVKRFWNKIVSETRLEPKGFKKVEVDYSDWL